jgi:hypothetical protein
MGISHTIALICLLGAILGWQIRALLAQIRKLEQQIEEARLREQKLIDKLLTKAGFSPLLEREQAVVLPDPEIKQPNFIEEAFLEDGIMEEVEMMNPEMAGRGADYVRQVYPSVWEEAEKRYQSLYNAMRA